MLNKNIILANNSLGTGQHVHVIVTDTRYE